jgi:hypothetical protein
MAFMLALPASASVDSDRAYAAELRSLAYAEESWSPDQVRRDNSSMQISVLMQSRYMASSTEQIGGSSPSFEGNTTGFLLPRTQITFDGSIVSSQLTYKMTFDFGDAELGKGRGSSPVVPVGFGAATLLDAYVQYNFAEKREGYYLKAGQFKHVLHAEEAIDAQYQLAVERSLTNEFFNYGYTQGIALGRVERNWAWDISLSDGGRYLSSGEVANSSITSPLEADFALGLRIDRKFKGSWEQFNDFTSFQGSQSALRVGAGFMVMTGGETNPDGFVPPIFFPRLERSKVISWTVDVQYEGDGWNLFAAYMGNLIDWNFDTGAEINLANHGFVAQGGYFLSNKSEVFARVEAIWFDGAIPEGFGVSHGHPTTILAVGWNYYILPESHAAKFTVDVSAAIDDTFGFLVGVTSSDTLPDPSTTGFIGGADTEYLFRAQLQILF